MHVYIEPFPMSQSNTRQVLHMGLRENIVWKPYNWAWEVLSKVNPRITTERTYNVTDAEWLWLLVDFNIT